MNAVALSGIAREDQEWLYLPRLAGFGLLIVAIVVTNAGRGGSANS